jgi:hypothetical protein
MILIVASINTQVIRFFPYVVVRGNSLLNSLINCSTQRRNTKGQKGWQIGPYIHCSLTTLDQNLCSPLHSTPPLTLARDKP